MADNAAVLAAREKLKAKFGKATAQVGGKGSVRRNIKASHKPLVVDDKKLQAVLKKHSVTTMSGVEEVNIYKQDGQAVYFRSPKLQSNKEANTYVVSGTAETRPYNPREIYTKSELADMASKINSLPPNMPLPPNMTQAQAQALLAQLQSTGKLPANMGGAVDGQKAAGGDAPAESDDMPDLEGVNF